MLAVALHTEGDCIILNNCRLLGNQDTLYTGSEGGRLFFYNCYIEGTTDFIFGPSTAWFEQCLLHGKKNSYITAAATPSQQPFGYIFNQCSITAADHVTSLYLGRPWRPYAMTLFMNSELPKEIHPAGWHNWDNRDNEKTTRYSEYNNHGKGSNTEKRVTWSNVLSKDVIEKITLENVMGDFYPLIVTETHVP